MRGRICPHCGTQMNYNEKSDPLGWTEKCPNCHYNIQFRYSGTTGSFFVRTNPPEIIPPLAYIPVAPGIYMVKGLDYTGVALFDPEVGVGKEIRLPRD